MNKKVKVIEIPQTFNFNHDSKSWNLLRGKAFSYLRRGISEGDLYVSH